MSPILRVGSRFVWHPLRSRFLDLLGADSSKQRKSWATLIRSLQRDLFRKCLQHVILVHYGHYGFDEGNSDTFQWSDAIDFADVKSAIRQQIMDTTSLYSTVNEK